MVPLYAVFLAALGGLKWVLAGRAARTEKKFMAAALAAQQAARPVKPGNASGHDALAAAKKQYELGRLVQARDVLEARYHGWQARAERAASTLTRLRSAKGLFIPYLCGVVDVALVLAALHALGLPHGLNPDQVRAWAEVLMK
jgi:hypothetical protein